ncbi:MAG: sulfur oxidation c-type cytochrome SoxX [Sulfurimonas sp.]|nr:sulfur oxidation c-type cytochrome SoxX [Sulfurimonas sp.]
MSTLQKNMMISLFLGASLFATDYSSVIESPDATKIIEKDRLAPATAYKIPEGCISTDPKAIARGAYIFHNLNGKKAKMNPPAGLRKNAKGKNKQYGNCVACHNIEGAQGGGNIGPDLTNYSGIFMESKVRNNQFVYQKIADSRVDNPNTHMTVNLTTKLFNEREICDMTSYIVSPK